jgi:hypothetical protein
MARILLGIVVLVALLCLPAGALASVTSFGGAGNGDGQFTALNAIALDAAGYVYAVDGGSASRVQVFSNLDSRCGNSAELFGVRRGSCS